MKRSKRLARILDIALDHERDAAKAFAESREKFDSGLDQLEELRSLQTEYAELLQAQGQTGLVAGKLKDYLVFIERLSKAVSRQAGLVSQSERLMDSRRGEWSKRRAHSQAMGELVDRERQQERRKTARRLERELEDSGSRLNSGTRSTPVETE